MSELKPCPFCGGCDISREYGAMDEPYMICMDCECSLDGNHNRWNRRADLPPTLSAAMELPEVRALVETMAGLKRIVEEIDGAMNHGTWRDEKGMRLKDTPEWVSAYVALAAIKEPKL